jgi:hypothetical protein
MAVAKKGLRTISVSGTKYLWRAIGTDDGIDLIVTDETRTGQVLKITFDYEPGLLSSFKSNSAENMKQTVVTPAVVQKVIEQGLKTGWLPGTRGKTFEIKAHSILKPGN